MRIEFIDGEGSFLAEGAEDTGYLYFPIANEAGVMGSIAPNLAGDTKTGQNSFLLEPVSAENLHSSTMGRNIWCRIAGKGVWSAAGNSALQYAQKYEDKRDRTSLVIGKLWQKVRRSSEEYGISADILSFCPASREKAEIMRVTFCNTGAETLQIEPIAAIPIYGRSADNLRDHRHVTALLHRIRTTEDGVSVKPVLSFDERGHQINENTYGVFARGEKGERPVGFYPVLQEFIGEGGNLLWPEAVVKDTARLYPAGSTVEGYEAMGGIRFAMAELKPGEKKTYCIVLSYDGEGMQYLEEEQVNAAWKDQKNWWNSVSKVSCHSGDEGFDHFMSWVGIQPTLRRIYGCSFLPHHDYGRGGRGWRDLWQDSLSLLLSDPQRVRPMLVSYFDGVRIDGSNATIIGTKPGEFVADRNSIVRVWMDHGLWPFITVKQYIDLTGDYKILFEEGTYFKDRVCCRGEGRDELWDGKTAVLQTPEGMMVKSSVLERILLQHLTMFYDVGEHNHMRLRGADWNDALDMARENGESVAFSAAYSGNLKNLAELLYWMRTEQGVAEVELAQELQLLLESSQSCYDSWEEKQRILQEYCDSCRHTVSGRKVKVPVLALEENLRQKASWIQNHIRQTEWVGDGEENHWFNGYYDNQKRQVEGRKESGVRMMLTSQVFTIMSGTATNEQTEQICNAADRYLYEESVGGYRLNTDFKELKTDLGRMFGFAYGHKENGAVFCHMAVMYAYSLYSRDFVKEGYKVISALYRQVMHTEVSCIYPGIPEYFNDKGRGMYHYLTGAASWLVLTVLTEMFGVKGVRGDLLLQPKLLAEQFDEGGRARISFTFAEQQLRVIYENPNRREIGDYTIEEIYIDKEPYAAGEEAVIPRTLLTRLMPEIEHQIRVVLS
ncbi:MAG: cellobiose phosphorylase [Lachnospiraceae bacterium]|nr:cellobiose phosphorylase [Lachnospiraceae bacterium]